MNIKQRNKSVLNKQLNFMTLDEQLLHKKTIENKQK